MEEDVCRRILFILKKIYQVNILIIMQYILSLELFLFDDIWYKKKEFVFVLYSFECSC